MPEEPETARDAPPSAPPKSAPSMPAPADPPPPDPDQLRREAIDAERRRIGDIRTACAAFGCREIEDDLITGGLPINEVRARIQDHVAARQTSINPARPTGTGYAVVTADGSDKFREGASQALLARAGLGPRDDANELQGFSLREMARHTLQMHSGRVIGGRPMEMVGRALTHTSSDFGSVLINVADKAMLKGYEEAGETF